MNTPVVSVDILRRKKRKALLPRVVFLPSKKYIGWGLALGFGGQAVNAFPVFLRPFARAFHAKSHPVAARPYGGPTAPVILGASRECIP